MAFRARCGRTPVIPGYGRPKREDQEFSLTLHYIASGFEATVSCMCLKTKEKARVAQV